MWMRPSRHILTYRDIVLCHPNRRVCKLLIADLEEAALIAGRAKTMERRIEYVSPKAPRRHAAAFVIPKSAGTPPRFTDKDFGFMMQRSSTIAMIIFDKCSGVSGSKC